MRTVVTRGYGSFGTIAFVTTAGFSIGAAIASIVEPVIVTGVWAVDAVVNGIWRDAEIVNGEWEVDI